jgi:hypothetical protein
MPQASWTPSIKAKCHQWKTLGQPHTFRYTWKSLVNQYPYRWPVIFFCKTHSSKYTRQVNRTVYGVAAYPNVCGWPLIVDPNNMVNEQHTRNKLLIPIDQNLREQKRHRNFPHFISWWRRWRKCLNTKEKSTNHHYKLKRNQLIV